MSVASLRGVGGVRIRRRWEAASWSRSGRRSAKGTAWPASWQPTVVASLSTGQLVCRGVDKHFDSNRAVVVVVVVIGTDGKTGEPHWCATPIAKFPCRLSQRGKKLNPVWEVSPGTMYLTRIRPHVSAQRKPRSICFTGFLVVLFGIRVFGKLFLSSSLQCATHARLRNYVAAY